MYVNFLTSSSSSSSFLFLLWLHLSFYFLMGVGLVVMGRQADNIDGNHTKIMN